MHSEQRTTYFEKKITNVYERNRYIYPRFSDSDLK